MTLLNLSGEAPLCEYTPVLPRSLFLCSFAARTNRAEVGKFISALMGRSAQPDSTPAHVQEGHIFVAGLIGVGFVTIPMGLLGSGFQDYLEQEDGHTSFSRQVELFELCEDDDDAVAKPGVGFLLAARVCREERVRQGQAKPESEQSEHSFRIDPGSSQQQFSYSEPCSLVRCLARFEVSSCTSSCKAQHRTRPEVLNGSLHGECRSPQGGGLECLGSSCGLL